jgi:hypothetical protein
MMQCVCVLAMACHMLTMRPPCLPPSVAGDGARAKAAAAVTASGFWNVWWLGGSWFACTVQVHTVCIVRVAPPGGDVLACSYVVLCLAVVQLGLASVCMVSRGSAAL